MLFQWYFKRKQENIENKPKTNRKRDWHNYQQISEEAQRKGKKR